MICTPTGKPSLLCPIGATDAGVVPLLVKALKDKNLDVRYAFAGGWSTSLGIYNLLNTHASAAQFWYVDRLRNEIDSYPDGRADVHEHPLEPIMARLTVTRKF